MSTTREALAAALDYLERNSPANGYGLLDHDADKERREAIAKIEAAIAATPEQAPAALPSSLGVSPSGPGSTLQPAVSAAIPDAIPADPFVGVAVSDPAVWRTDPAYAQACLVVRAQKRAAISTVQRHLRIGYNRAARLLEAMVGDVIAEMPPTTKLLPARGIEREARESEGPSPKGDEPGGEATRPEQIAALTAQVEALRQDAERWRFLRAQHEGDDAESFTVFSAVEPREFALEPVGSLPGELDRIVDAAMKDKGEFGAEMQSGGNPQTQVKQGES